MYAIKDLSAGNREIRAAKSAFFAGGFAMSTWAPMIPYIKTGLSISADVLGMLLLSIGLSAFICMPAAGILARHFGCRAVITGATLVMAAVLVLLPVLPALWCYFPILFMFGAALGTLDVAMNLNSVVVERVSGKRILSAVHGFWSIGCFIGAGLFILLAKTGLSVPFIALIHAALILSAAFFFYPHLLPFRGDGGHKALSTPRGIVLILGIMTCCTFLAEGAIMDWAGVLLNEAKNVPLEEAGLGFTVYSAAMLTMRLIGDRIVARLGEKPVAVGGSLIAAAGFAGINLASSLPVILPCFLLLGIGLANVVPVIYSLLAHQDDMPVDSAVTVLTTMGYSGVILGPSLLGFLAQHAGLLSVFYMLAAFLLIQAAGAVLVLKTK